MTDDEKIRAAIRRAETKSRAEIHVHREEKCGDPRQRARELFERFAMTETEERTGVLVYIATESRRLALLSDVGIDGKVGQDYWHGVEPEARRAIREGRIADALVLVIDEIGSRLQKDFPRLAGDPNELPDRIT